MIKLLLSCLLIGGAGADSLTQAQGVPPTTNPATSVNLQPGSVSQSPQGSTVTLDTRPVKLPKGPKKATAKPDSAQPAQKPVPKKAKL